MMPYWTMFLFSVACAPTKLVVSQDLSSHKESTPQEPPLKKTPSFQLEPKSMGQHKRSVKKTPPQTERFIADATIDLSMLLEKEKIAVALKPTTKWPFVAWKYAKLYTFNFSSRSTSTPWRDAKHDLRQVIEVSTSQANVALELVHRMRGGGIYTKCPFDPRHAVVFYNEKDEEVAYFNICFSCQDSVAWPDYGLEVEGIVQASEEEQRAYEEGDGDFSYDDIETHRMAVLNKWQSYFTRLGADLYSRK